MLGTDHLTWRGGLWFFVSFRIFFLDKTRVWIFIFFVAQSANFFFQNITLGYMTKTLNQIIFVFLHQNQNIFFSNIGNQNIFFDKNHNPPSPPFKLNSRSLTKCSPLQLDLEILLSVVFFLQLITIHMYMSF